MKKNDFKFENILFENRNKSYGAYELRFTQDFVLMKAFFAGISILLIAIFCIWSINNFVFKNEIKSESVHEIFELIPLDEIEKTVLPEEKHEQKKVEKSYQQATKQSKYVMPEAKVKLTQKEEPLKKTKEIEKGDLGTFERKGFETDQIAGGGEVNLDKSKNKFGPQNTDENEVDGKVTEKISKKTETIRASRAKIMAIYPGCEKEKSKGNLALQKCLSQKISAALQTELNDFEVKATKEGLTSANAKLDFVINTEGKITKVGLVNGSDKLLGEESKKALEKMASKLAMSNKFIIPAEIEEGVKVNLNFQIPVNFKTQ